MKVVERSISKNQSFSGFLEEKLLPPFRVCYDGYLSRYIVKVGYPFKWYDPSTWFTGTSVASIANCHPGPWEVEVNMYSSAYIDFIKQLACQFEEQTGSEVTIRNDVP